MAQPRPAETTYSKDSIEERTPGQRGAARVRLGEADLAQT
jgi:hypothetical protein